MSSALHLGSYWDYGDTAEDAIHRIHSYPAKFPAFITSKALDCAAEQGIVVNVVADVFCGCGTAAVEARKNGKHFWGCDINPLAALIAQVKTHHYRDSVLLRYYNQIRGEFNRTKLCQDDYVFIGDRITYWFETQNIEDLLRLDLAIRRCTPPRSRHRKFFLCAFSNILKPTSFWLTKSIKAQRDPNKAPRKVMETFEDQFELMRSANRDNRFPVPSAKVHIKTQDFLASTEPACLVDLIVTSPPYVTSYDYADIHQLSSLWLRYASDYRTLRKCMVGNQYRVRPPDRKLLRQLGIAVDDTYRSLLRVDRRKGYSVGRYFIDLDRAAKKCASMLNAGGMVVIVIGNTNYKGIKIDNANHLANCMERAGLIHLEKVQRKISRKTMTPYRDSLGRFSRDATCRKVYSEEFVIIGRKQ